MPTTLKELRLKTNLTQPKLAKLLGLHRVTIARYEGGDIIMPKPIRLLAARIFNMEPDDILDPPVKHKAPTSL